MPTHKSKFTAKNPAPSPAISRRQYVAARHWKWAGMTKEKYAKMLNLIRGCYGR